MLRAHTLQSPPPPLPPRSVIATAAVVALLLIPWSAMAQPPTPDAGPEDDFFHREDAEGPPVCKGGWCALTISTPATSGHMSYSVLLRDPQGKVTETGVELIGSPPYYVLDERGRIKGDPGVRVWESPSEEEEPEPPTFDAPKRTLKAALAACKKASPACAKQFVAAKGTCNRRGCVVSVRSEEQEASCFMWQAKGSEKMELLALYSERFGYSGPDALFLGKSIDIGGSDCKNGCEDSNPGAYALVLDRLRRSPSSGEIPESPTPWKDLSQVPPVEVSWLEQVTYGPFSWESALDAATRWRLALTPDHLQVSATVVDDILEIQPCAEGKRASVTCDHLELLAEDGPSKGAMLSVLLLTKGAARVERWREPGGKDLQEPLEAGRCSWARPAQREAPRAANELRVECELPREVLWGPGSNRSLTLRYSDAEGGRQQSLMSATRTFRASSEYPPLFVPVIAGCTSAP